MAIIYWKKINKLFFIYFVHLPHNPIGSKSEMELFKKWIFDNILEEMSSRMQFIDSLGHKMLTQR